MESGKVGVNVIYSVLLLGVADHSLVSSIEVLHVKNLLTV